VVMMGDRLDRLIRDVHTASAGCGVLALGDEVLRSMQVNSESLWEGGIGTVKFLTTKTKSQERGELCENR